MNKYAAYAQDAPLYAALLRYIAKNPARFHMPGHKGASSPLDLIFGDFSGSFPHGAAFDVTELPETDSLFEDCGPIREAERRAARVYGARETLFSAGGATLCIQAMLRLVSPLGHNVVCGRNIHRCAVNAMALLGLNPIWLWPQPCSCSLPGTVSPADIEEAVAKSRDIAAVYITSPDYYGTLSDIEGIAAVCKRHSIPLLVDNSHGAHLHLCGERLHPLRLGADITCDSAHKTLPVLTGGAYLNIAGGFEFGDAKDAMALFGSTSPSYLIMLSLDLARAFMEHHGKAAFAQLCERVKRIKVLCAEKGFIFPDVTSDPTRLTLNTASCGMTGGAAYGFFEKRGISCEMHDDANVVLIPSPFNSESDFSRLEGAVRDFPINKPLALPECTYLKPERALALYDALRAPRIEVDTDGAAGKTAAEVKCPCPPGIPIVMPGEKITKEIAVALKKYGVLSLKVLK